MILPAWVARLLRPPAPQKTVPVPTGRRLAIALLLGLYTGFRTWLIGGQTSIPRDVSQVWFAARALLHHQDPYSLIGPGLAFDWPAPLFYPLPAAVAAVPLAPLPMLPAAGLFMAIGGACFAWALMEHGYGPLFGYASAAMVFAAEVGQWSPLLASAFVISPLLALWVVKPTIGTAFLIARPNWWALAGVVGLGGLAFIIQPDWVSAWRHALASASTTRASGFAYIAPVFMPGGFLTLAALARWRRPEARLLVAMACVPQTLLVYEAVPLFLIPRTLRETELMVGLSYLAFMLMSRSGNFSADIDSSGRWIVLLLYLPATVLVLRRPNEGDFSPALQRAVAHVRGLMDRRAKRSSASRGHTEETL